MSKYSTSDPAFEHWVDWVFNHPVTNPEWYQSENAELWTASAVTTLDYVTRLFETAPTHLRAFSDAQASQGLWFLAGSFFCDGLSRLFDQDVLNSQRQRCIGSIYKLYKEYLAVRCSPHLGHIAEPGANPLNQVCYMWWDFIYYNSILPEDQCSSDVNLALLSVMAKILELNQDAGSESALHGLGHWHRRCPERVTAIIDSFLTANPNLRPELRDYALNARSGCVL